VFVAVLGPVPLQPIPLIESQHLRLFECQTRVLESEHMFERLET